MILKRLFQDLARHREARDAVAKDSKSAIAPSVLNVGGGSKQIPIPEHYASWTHLLLDVDAAGGPDIICDARKLTSLAAEQFNAVYCSHNLEHYYRHDVDKVLCGFLHLLLPDGFAEIRVPDLRVVMERFVDGNMDIEDVLYNSAAGPITIRDVIYGWAEQIEKSGVDFYAHKTGFTSTSLESVLRKAGFGTVLVAERKEAFELCALAFKGTPTDAHRVLLGL